MTWADIAGKKPEAPPRNIPKEMKAAKATAKAELDEAEREMWEVYTDLKNNLPLGVLLGVLPENYFSYLRHNLEHNKPVFCPEDEDDDDYPIDPPVFGYCRVSPPRETPQEEREEKLAQRQKAQEMMDAANLLYRQAKARYEALC